ncbi:MAG: DUF2288 domain-containing protein [Labilithrix sp.]|nr:DUF2288 domain-containing protein [Labilithrix sp.]MBX3210571.1 DUF2288 domain-containing protein [Labilithrix sp.]
MRESLAASMGPIEFSDIRAHLARDAVIVVDASLDLLEVGEAVARDDKERVGAWVERGLIGKPSLATIEAWSKTEGAAWTALVVQPFVLLREGLTTRDAS